MVGGTISDIFDSKDRGTPMNLFGVGSLTGTGLGPFVAGFIYSNDKLGWRYGPPSMEANDRWIFWMQLILNLFWLAVMIVFLPETRGSVILRRRVDKLRKETGDLTLVAVGDESRASIGRLIKISTTRPLMLLFTEHIVFWFSLWVSFTWGILYLFLNTISQVMRKSHDFNTMQVGLAFLGMIFGGLLGFATSPIQGYFYSRAAKKNLGKPRPEARLYFSCLGSLMFASGLFWFGWSSGPNVHWIVPILGIGWTIIGIYSVYVSPALRDELMCLDCCVQLPGRLVYYLCFVGAGRTEFHAKYVCRWLSHVQYSNERSTWFQLEYEFTWYLFSTALLSQVSLDLHYLPRRLS